jgi:hypothetical protein
MRLVSGSGVTRHAVEQFRRRLLWQGGALPSSQIRGLLLRIYREGRRVRRLPGGLAEYELEGLRVAVDERSGTVVTFNGDREWRRFWKRTDLRKRYCRKALAWL